MRIVLPLALLFGLAACAVGPRTVDTTGPTVTYDFARGDMAQADARAEEYCAQYQMEPEVVEQTQSGGQYRATYRCTRGGLLGDLFGG